MESHEITHSFRSYTESRLPLSAYYKIYPDNSYTVTPPNIFLEGNMIKIQTKVVYWCAIDQTIRSNIFLSLSGNTCSSVDLHYLSLNVMDTLSRKYNNLLNEIVVTVENIVRNEWCEHHHIAVIYDKIVCDWLNWFVLYYSIAVK